jgi:hypothetical protein
MYSRFLAELQRPETALAQGAADQWTRLAGLLLAASEEDEPDPARWSQVGEAARGVLEAEERLWGALAESAN